MTLKKFLITLTVVAFLFLAFIGFASWKAYNFFSREFGEDRVPPELKQVRIIKGAELLNKTVFAEPHKMSSRLPFTEEDAKKEKNRTDTISIGELDGQQGLDVAIIGNQGTAFLDTNGNLKKYIFYEFEKKKMDIGPFSQDVDKERLSEMKTIDMEGDGICEYMSNGYSGTDGTAVFNHQGKFVWGYGEFIENSNSYLDYATAGDIDGDGVLEFVVSMSDKLQVFDRNGNKKWEVQTEFGVKQIEFVDVDGDEKKEMLTASMDRIEIRDLSGKLLRKVDLPTYFSRFALCQRRENNNTPQALMFDDGFIYLIGLDEKEKESRKFEAPLSEIKLAKPRRIEPPLPEAPTVTIDSESIYHYEAVWVKLKKDQPKYLAVVANYILPRGMFYLYDEKGQLVYQEILPEELKAIAVLPPTNENNTEELLVGGDKTVWRYNAR